MNDKQKLIRIIPLLLSNYIRTNMKKSPSSILELPNEPALYAMYGGKSRGLYIAYIGIAGKLKRRVMEHLVKCDSSVATGTSATSLNPDYITEVRWWSNKDFNKRGVLEAAELVAFDVFNPALRSRGSATSQAIQLYEKKGFREKIKALLKGEPSGRLIIPTLESALEKIASLERRLSLIEKEFVNK